MKLCVVVHVAIMIKLLSQEVSSCVPYKPFNLGAGGVTRVLYKHLYQNVSHLSVSIVPIIWLTHCIGHSFC